MFEEGFAFDPGAERYAVAAFVGQEFVFDAFGLCSVDEIGCVAEGDGSVVASVDDEEGGFAAFHVGFFAVHSAPEIDDGFDGRIAGVGGEKGCDSSCRAAAHGDALGVPAVFGSVGHGPVVGGGGVVDGSIDGGLDGSTDVILEPIVDVKTGVATLGEVLAELAGVSAFVASGESAAVDGDEDSASRFGGAVGVELQGFSVDCSVDNVAIDLLCEDDGGDKCHVGRLSRRMRLAQGTFYRA